MTDQNLRLPTRRNNGYYFLGAGVLCAVAIALAGCSGSGKKDPFAGVGSPIWDDAKGPMPKGRRQAPCRQALPGCRQLVLPET